MNIKTTQNLFIAIILLAWIGIFFDSYSFDLGTFDWKTLASDSGWLAWGLLITTIFIGLGNKIFPKVKIFKKLLPFRKYTGMFTFIVGIAHGIIRLFYETTSGNIPSLHEYLSTDISMIFANIGAFMMVLPFVTSTIWAVKKLGPRLWKNIQRLTHISFLGVSLHIFFVGYTTHNSTHTHIIIPLGLYVIGYVYLWIKQK